MGRAAHGRPIRDVTWVSDDFLREHEVGEWMELPLWLVDPELGRAARGGREPRRRRRSHVPPCAETLAGAADAPLVDGVGLTPEREAELLAAWHGR